MCIATVPGLWIERHFVQAIIHEDQTAVGDSEFGNPNRLRSEVNSDQAGRSGHGVKGLNRNSKMPNQISMVKCFGNWPDIINTGLEAGAHEKWSSKSRFQRLTETALSWQAVKTVEESAAGDVHRFKTQR
jgi:hypothetical protein